MSKKRIDIMISPDIIEKVDKSRKRNNTSRSLFMENAAVAYLNRPATKLAIAVPYSTAKESNNFINFQVNDEERPYYGLANNYIEELSFVKDALTGNEKVVISYISDKTAERTRRTAILTGKELVLMIEKHGRK